MEVVSVQHKPRMNGDTMWVDQIQVFMRCDSNYGSGFPMDSGENRVLPPKVHGQSVGWLR